MIDFDRHRDALRNFLLEDFQRAEHPEQDVVSADPRLDPRFVSRIPNDWRADPSLITRVLTAFGAHDVAVLFGREVDPSTYPLAEAVGLVNKSAGSRVASCIPGVLAYCRDEHGRLFLLNRTAHLLAESGVVRTPFRILGALFGSTFLVVAGMLLVSLLHDAYRLGMASVEWRLGIFFLMLVGLGVVFLRAAWTGHDPFMIAEYYIRDAV